MGNPFFGIMGGGGRPNMMHQFQQFMSQMQGKDPNAIINEMVQSGNQNSLNMQSIGTLGESAILLSHFHQVFHHYHQEGRYFCAEFHCLCAYKYLLLFEYQRGPSTPLPR